MSNVVQLSKNRFQAEEISDLKLLEACAQGQMAALGTLFHRYQADVYVFLSRLSGTDEAELDDLVQNTFMQVQRSAGGFQNRSQVKSWIFGIASNVAKRHVRTSVRRKNAFRLLREQPQTKETACVHQTVEQRNMIQQLESALEKLSYKLRVVFVMCDMEGISGVEAAKTLDLKEGTLWRRLHDARRKLAAELEGSLS